MPSIFGRRNAATVARADLRLDATRALVGTVRYELVPVTSVERAIGDLPPRAPVSVTCSPVKGVSATLDLTARLLDLGHDAVPHVSARLIASQTQTASLARWIRDHAVREVFVIAGDVADPAGPYPDVTSLLGDLLAHDTGLARVGVAAYPDGHAFITRGALHASLHAKQDLLAAAGVAGSATTQMCFDPARVERWLLDERERGLELPVDLGIPGVVDRAKLMAMGVRLGVGASLRYLGKNRRTMTAMLTPGRYDPTDLVAPLAANGGLGLRGLHAFTFNSVAATRAWQRSVVDT